MFTPIYMENSYSIDYNLANCESNERDAFNPEDIVIRSETQSLSSAEINSIADKISDKLIKLVENQLNKQQ